MSSDQMNNRILVIDDDPNIHEDFRKILMPPKSDSELDDLDDQLFAEEGDTASPAFVSNFDVDFASQGQEGLQCINEAIAAGRPYPLAFVDMRMPPGWDGLETIQHIWKIDKEILIVICTAYTDYGWDELVRQLGPSDRVLILKKPFDISEIQQMALAMHQRWNREHGSLDKA